MNIINARDGKQNLTPGDTFADPLVIFPDPPAEWEPKFEDVPVYCYDADIPVTLVAVEDYILTARAKVRAPWGEEKWVPLMVRLTHPSFFLRRVAFIPT